MSGHRRKGWCLFSCGELGNFSGRKQEKESGFV
jgi:hypothetical protein